MIQNGHWKISRIWIDCQEKRYDSPEAKAQTTWESDASWTMQVTVVREAGWQSFLQYELGLDHGRLIFLGKKKLNFMIKLNNICSEEHWKNLG